MLQTHEGNFAYPWRSLVSKLNASASYPGGLSGGVPLTLWDDSGNRSLVMSPANHYMVSSIAALGPRTLGAGLLGSLEVLPAQLEVVTLLVGGAMSVPDTIKEWGALLRLKGAQKPAVDSPHWQEVPAQRVLSYWTANGDWYWHDLHGHSDYGAALVAAKESFVSNDIPVGAWQYDSWWYYEDKHGCVNVTASEHGPPVIGGGGCTRWEPTASSFPAGFPKQMGALTRWSCNTSYVEHFEFLVEGNFALPLEEEFFVHIMSHNQPQLQVFEQDWLISVTQGMPALSKSLSLGSQWMQNMDAAADKLGLTMMLCMPLPCHWLQSTLMPTVRSIRASNDFRPDWDVAQWAIADNNAFIAALGAKPFKDAEWSSYEDVAGCQYPLGCQSRDAEVELLASSLSAGPVAFGDAPHAVNRTLLMRACRADGILLKPRYPVTPLPLAYTLAAKSGAFHLLWSASNTLAGHEFRYVLGANLTESVQVSIPEAERCMDWFTKRLVVGDTLLFTPQGTNPRGHVKFSYVVCSPRSLAAHGGWAFFGELGSKYVSVASQRFAGLSVLDGQLEVFFQPHWVKELVHVVFVSPALELVVLSCDVATAKGVRCAGSACNCF